MRINDPKYLLLQYPLNNTSKEILNRNPGNWSGTEGYAETNYNHLQGANLTGANYITLGSAVTLSPPFSVSIWYKPGTLAGYETAWSFIGSNQAGIDLNMGGGGTSMTCRIDTDGNPNQAIFNQNTSIKNNNLNQIVVTCNPGSLLTLYVNGEFKTNTFFNGSLITNFTTIGIGRKNYGNHGNGILKDFRVYNTNLTWNEINQLYHQNE